MMIFFQTLLLIFSCGATARRGRGGAAADRRPGARYGTAVQVDRFKIRVESAYGVCNQRLKLQYAEMLSNFAFDFSLRRYKMGTERSSLDTNLTEEKEAHEAGTHGWCSPRHRMPYNSRNEG